MASRMTLRSSKRQTRSSGSVVPPRQQLRPAQRRRPVQPPRVIRAHISQLPPELLRHVFGYLGSVSDLGRVCQVCVAWRDTAYDPKLWRHVEAKLYGHWQWPSAAFLRGLARRGIRRLALKDLTQEIPAMGDLIKTMPLLESLSFNDCRNISDEWIGLLARKLTGLVVLNLSRCKSPSDVSLLCIACNLPKLEELYMAGCSRISDTGVECLTGVVREASGPRRISVLPVLRCLDLSGCALTDVSLRHVAGMTALRRLDLRDCYRITDTGLRNLAHSGSRVEQLDLSCCWRVTDDGMRHLSQMRRLRELKLNNCFVEERGLQYLAEGACRITRLDASGIGFPAGTGLLAAARHLRHLRTLQLDAGMVCHEGLVLAARNLSRLHTLTVNGRNRIEDVYRIRKSAT